MRIVFWGTYDTSKPRNRILRSGLIEAGASVEEIHSRVWENIEDKSQVRGLGPRLRVLTHWLCVLPRLVWQLLRAPKSDLIVVGYPGIIDVLLAAAIGRLRGIPVVWDVFLSLYDTIVEDRGLLARTSVAARILHALESSALRRADLVFMDTAAHARRLETLFLLRPGSCGAVWVGVEAEYFAPASPRAAAEAGRPLRVLFYGQFIPLHGIPTIVEAARLLAGESVDWILVGRGQEAPRIRQMLLEQPLPRVQWIEWVEYSRLQQLIGEADICLGIFGTSAKAASVIPNKVFQILAAGRPLITRDSAAIRELVQPTPGWVDLVPPGCPAALADRVRAHQRRPVPFPNPPLPLPRVDARSVGAQFLAMIRERMTAIHGT
jgi:glycosyltransferase involved in cell wall biosynthesis